MTHIETARVNEVIGVHIGTIQEAAQMLNVNCDLQELEAHIATLERAVADLKESLAAVPHTPGRM